MGTRTKNFYLTTVLAHQWLEGFKFCWCSHLSCPCEFCNSAQLLQEGGCSRHLGNSPAWPSDNSSRRKQYLTLLSHVPGKRSASLAPHCLPWAPNAAMPIVKICFVRGLALSGWIRLDRACLTTLTVLLQSPLQGLFFVSPRRLGRRRVTALLWRAVPFLWMSICLGLVGQTQKISRS